MGQIWLGDNPPIEVTLRRSARARRISLRVSQLDGRVSLTLPRGVPEREGTEFLRAKETWLRRHLSRQEEITRPELGQEFPFLGSLCQIAPGAGRGVTHLDGVLQVGGAPDTVPARLQGWLKSQARLRLAAASDHYAAQLGRPYSKLTLRDTKSRWGSCTSQGGLMYSWRLIMAPAEVLAYVAAHEVAHLAEMNHSPAFWAVVEDLYGDWKPQRDWLRTHGAGLHRYQF